MSKILYIAPATEVQDLVCYQALAESFDYEEGTWGYAPDAGREPLKQHEYEA